MSPGKVTPLIKLRVQVDKKKSVEAIYDSGSNVSLINYRIIEELKHELMNQGGMLKTLSGVSFTKNRAKLNLKINRIEGTVDAYVVRKNEFSYDLLLGLDAIKKFGLIQDENLRIFQRVHENKIEEVTKQRSKPFETTLASEISAGECFNAERLVKDLSHLTPERASMILELMRKHSQVFARDKFDVGTVQNQEARIRLTEYRYVSKKPYRCSLPDQKEIESQIEKLLQAGLIEESSSPFGAPVTLAFKKEDGRKSRLCIDFRDLNKLVVPEAQPFPRIEDIMVKAVNCHWFSTIDINSAFWSVPISKQDREKTAFVTQRGHYQWLCLPFGLKVSPAIFQRILSNIIRKHKLQLFCINYIDDILVFSRSIEEHTQHVGNLSEVMQKEGFKLNLSKCNFAKNSVKYLGHVIERNGVRSAKDNLKAMRNFARPTNKKNVRQLLGKINFYYKYIDNASENLEPLHNLLRKTTNFKWTDECETAFKKIKNLLCSEPILSIYDQDKPVFIYTDASGVGLGAVLKQTQADGLLHPVAYFSRRLKPTELKKKAIYLECLAIKEAIVYWQHWLIGRDFTIVSDHKPLESMRVKARTDETLGVLMHYLSQYQFKIIYSSGKNNIEADSLSRNPVLECFENEEDILKVVNLVKLQELVRDQEENRDEINKAKKIVKRGDITYKNLKNRHRIFVSQNMGKWLIEKVHDLYGHIGARHICQKLRLYYYFKTMDRMVDEFCKNCEICIKNKTRSTYKVGKLSKLGPARRPFEIMSLDTVGGFAGYRSPKRYMHILIDHFSKRVFISTSKGQVARDFVNLIEKAIGNQDVRIILADQYPASNSAEVKQYLKSRNILLIFTSINSASSNGLNERVNQTLVNRIRCKINSGDRRAWTKIATDCVDEYNRTNHSVTKFEPDYLMYGKTSDIAPIELLERCDLQNDRTEALLNSIKDFERNKLRIDKLRREETFKVNEYVYVENGNHLNRGKLEEVRMGPFRVTRRVSHSMYEVDCGKRKKESNLFHVSKLKRALRPGGGEV